MASKLIIAIQNDDGFIPPHCIQGYSEWVNGERNIEILKIHRGRNLFDILAQDLGYIQLNENGILHLRHIIALNPRLTAMKLMGNIAEAIIVRRCNNDSLTNRKWAMYARKGNRVVNTPDRFHAIGTGHYRTRLSCCSKYNPNDTQKDIIWINKDNPTQELLQICRNHIDGQTASLQIKVSFDGKQYILSDLKNGTYEVPVVYFGLNNDFDSIANELYRQNSLVTVGVNFIDAKAIDYDAFSELEMYYQLVLGLLNGQIKPEDLISDKNLDNEITIAAIIKTAMGNFSSQRSILSI
jgi:hypothetical protein